MPKLPTWSRRLSEEQVISVRFWASAPFTTFRVNCSMSWFLYILRCKDQSLYTGITWDLKRRIKEHNTRTKSCLQLSKVPVKLVYYERFMDRFLAAKREKEVKGWSRVKKQKLIDSLH